MTMVFYTLSTLKLSQESRDIVYIIFCEEGNISIYKCRCTYVLSHLLSRKQCGTDNAKTEIKHLLNLVKTL